MGGTVHEMTACSQKLFSSEYTQILPLDDGDSEMITVTTIPEGYS
jgi:hypothetical protein